MIYRVLLKKILVRLCSPGRVYFQRWQIHFTPSYKSALLNMPELCSYMCLCVWQSTHIRIQEINAVQALAPVDATLDTPEWWLALNGARGGACSDGAGGRTRVNPDTGREKGGKRNATVKCNCKTAMSLNVEENFGLAALQKATGSCWMMAFRNMCIKCQWILFSQ